MLTHQTKKPAGRAFVALDEMTGLDSWRGFYLAGERLVTAMGDKLTPGVLNAYFWHRDYVFQAAAEVSQLRRRLSAIEALDLRAVRAVGVVRLGDLADALSDGERSAAARMQALQEALRA